MITRELQPNQVAVIAVDIEACFMPATEGERLGLAGYGELPCEDGEQVVQPMNELLAAGRGVGAYLAATRDWHKPETAHIAQDGNAPNFDTTWPAHGIEDTPGAEYHAELLIDDVVDYKKGNEVVIDPVDDDSYTGANGYDADGNMLLDTLVERGVRVAVLGGLALNYCVKATAESLLAEGIEVVIARDATKTVFTNQYDDAVAELQNNGVKFQTTDEILAGVLAA